MRLSSAFFAAGLMMLVLPDAGCRWSSSGAGRSMRVLRDSNAEFVHEFNALDDHPRLVLLLSPT